jgi:hypothetical protein
VITRRTVKEEIKGGLATDYFVNVKGKKCVKKSCVK